MRDKRVLILASLSMVVLIGLILIWNRPVVAAPRLQLTPFPTPTPGPDGRIIYIVQPNDTLLRISLISGVPVEELRGLNNLTGDTIVAGQELLLGLGGPPEFTPTPGPSPTPTALLPTPSPQPGLGNLCILLYNDINGDAIRQEEERSIADGAISVNNRRGTVSLTATTTAGEEPHCFEDLPEGEYNITVAIPEGYNATTVTNFLLKLNAGDETYLDFGAQVNSVKQAEAPMPQGSGRSPLLGIIGGVLLVSGAILAFFTSRRLRGR